MPGSVAPQLLCLGAEEGPSRGPGRPRTRALEDRETEESKAGLTWVSGLCSLNPDVT